LPPIDGWTIKDRLLDVDDLGRGYLDYWDIGELPTAVDRAAKPTRDLTEYRCRLSGRDVEQHGNVSHSSQQPPRTMKIFYDAWYCVSITRDNEWNPG
jgi:hypothetical protein